MFCTSDAPTFLLETNVSQSISFSISLRKIFFFILSLLLFHQSPLIRDGYLKGPSALLSHSCPVFTWFQSFSWRISENTIHLATWTSWELHQKEVCTCFHGHIKCWGNILSHFTCVTSHFTCLTSHFTCLTSHFTCLTMSFGDMEKLKKNQCHFLWSKHLVFHISHAPSIVLEPNISQSITKRKSTFHALALMKWSQWLMDYTKPRIFHSTYRIGFWSR